MQYSLLLSTLYMFQAVSPTIIRSSKTVHTASGICRGELSYLAPLDSENISAPYFKQCFFQGGITPQTESNTTPPSPKTELNLNY